MLSRLAGWDIGCLEVQMSGITCDLIKAELLLAATTSIGTMQRLSRSDRVNELPSVVILSDCQQDRKNQLQIGHFQGLETVQGAQAGKPAKSRGDPQMLHPETLVTAQPWFEDGNGYTRLAKNVRLGNVSIWELRSVIELVDLLLWPHIKDSKGLAQKPWLITFSKITQGYC